MYQVDVSRLLGNEPDEHILFFNEQLLTDNIQVINKEYETLSPINIDFSIENIGGTLLLTGQVNVTLRLNCSRCLEDFEYDFTNSLKKEYYSSETQLDSTVDIDESQIIPEDQQQIDIEPAVYESIALGFPVKVLCSPDCKGLCVECGINLNEDDCSCQIEVVDPRLVKLKDFKDQNEK